MSELNVRVVIRNGRDRRLNVVPDGEQEHEAWDGDQQLMLNRNGPPEQNLGHRLAELRRRPQLAAMTTPVARGLQDTIILWGAWKSSVLDILEQVSEHDLLCRFQKLSEQDEMTTRHRLRDLFDQMTTTMSSWRSQVKFLQDERVQLVASLQERTMAESSAADALEAQDTSKPVHRVLCNAVKAVENTGQERQQLLQKKFQLDAGLHFETLKGLRVGIRFIVQAFVKDAQQLQHQANMARKDLNDSVKQKENAWAQVCQQQYAEYYKGLHHPLTKMLQEIDPTATRNMLLQQTFDNENDPHCLRRCEVALSLLRQAQARLIAPADSPAATAADVDDIMKLALTERGVAEQREQQHYTERWLALQFEHAQRERALNDASTRLKKLQDVAQQIQQGLQLTFQEQEVDQKKLAVASRLAEQQLSQLRDDIQQTYEAIALEKRQIEAMQTNLSAQDRAIIFRNVLDATHRVYQVCRTMRSRFEAATQAEDMLHHMIHEQYLKGLRDLHQVSQGTIRRMIQVAQSQFAQVQVQLDRLQDAAYEASRRIDTLHRGRLTQEEQGTAQDIGIFRAIEEFADCQGQRRAFQETLLQVEAMRSIAEQAGNFLQSMQTAG